MENFLAFDLGAGSGRAILGRLKEKRLDISEISRFPNRFIKVGGRYFWDMLFLFSEIKKALSKAKEAIGDNGRVSASVDTWGVDFALFTKEGILVSNPFSYRDNLFIKAMNEFLKEFGQEKLYSKTGIQYLSFNTIFQLYSLKKYNPSLLVGAEHLLMLPDAFNYLLSGKMAAELTIASTTSLLDPYKKIWDRELINYIGIPENLFKSIVKPGTILGEVREEIKNETGISDCTIISTAGHDTACAVCATPGRGEDWAYISSGTWALVGVELDSPNLTKEAYNFGFTNEQGAGEKVRFLKNVTGLWILERAKEDFGNPSWDKIKGEAEKAPQFQAFIDPDWEGFLNPGNMLDAVEEYIKNRKQKVNRTMGSISRIILESLAMKIAYVIKCIEKITRKKIKVINMVGGGTKNELLCRFISNATGLKLITGPDEATSFGNILLQAMALGKIQSIDELRSIVMNSCIIEEYDPEDTVQWEKQFDRFLEVVGLEV